MALRILAIGECMAELSPAEEPGTFRLGFAGDTFNTAWYLARLAPNLPVAYFTAIGRDKLSADLKDFAAASGVDTSHIAELPGRNIGMYLISLENGERSFSYWRGQSAARDMVKDHAAVNRALGEADLIFFSGITLAILRAEDRAWFLDALRMARNAGKTIAFDPNLRPRLWESGDEMTGAIMQGAALCDIALPSFEDEATWFNDASPRDTAQRYLGAGATRVIVKNGAGAVTYADGAESGEFTVQALQSVTDTTAAGDSFNAGILAGIAEGQTLSDAIELSCQLAREVVQHKGALVPFVADRFGWKQG